MKQPLLALRKPATCPAFGPTGRANPPAEGGAYWSLTTLREKLIEIGVKVVRHGRSIMFQLAEVAIARSLFANIRRLIDGLRPALLPR